MDIWVPDTALKNKTDVGVLNAREAKHEDVRPKLNDCVIE